MLDRHPPNLALVAGAAAPVADRLKDFAVQRLWSAIIRCELNPGEIVSEARLAEHFGLGKAPIRFALARIAATGLAVPIARFGYQIAPVTLQSLNEVSQMLRCVEPEIATVRLDRGDPDRLMRLVAIAEMREGGQAGESARQALRELRHTILIGTGNGMLLRTLSELWDQADRLQVFVRSGNGPDIRWDLGLPTVAVLVDALGRQDAKTVERLLQRRVAAWHRAMTQALLDLNLDVPLRAPAGDAGNAPADAHVPQGSGYRAAAGGRRGAAVRRPYASLETDTSGD